jgi:hypothetical protein
VAFIICSTNDCIHNKWGECDLSNIEVDDCYSFVRDETKKLREEELVKLRLWNIAMVGKKGE